MAQAQAHGGLGRSPTFFVGGAQQRKNLNDFQKREQQLAEAYFQNKPLCFRGRGYQKTHPVKAASGAPGAKGAPAFGGRARGLHRCVADRGLRHRCIRTPEQAPEAV
ncbi:unnamed protein product [Prorocentrum cordatum]|uniref:Uncharacterized protein n=1 Tax=Prorocentrum cordatum TaxID=2364126 RepID=A0ABN9TYD4_9DINO|nr:unnamed protein product [Polarella glacialis]